MQRDDFRDFIISLLKRGGVKKQLDNFTDNESMEAYRLACVDTTKDETYNFEPFEFVGDTILNLAVALYIKERHPEIINVGWMTKIKHYTVSNKIIAEFAVKHGYDKFAVFAPGITRAYLDETRKSSGGYMGTIADIFEAILGAVSEVINKKTKSHVGISVAIQIVYSVLDEEGLETDLEKVYDAKSRLKELYDKMRWKFNKETIRTKMLGEKRWRAVVGGYPKGDKTPIPENYISDIASAFGTDQREAEMNVSKMAIKALAVDWGIVMSPKDREIQKNK